jgi:hypothetical protein
MRADTKSLRRQSQRWAIVNDDDALIGLAYPTCQPRQTVDSAIVHLTKQQTGQGFMMPGQIVQQDREGVSSSQCAGRFCWTKDTSCSYQLFTFSRLYVVCIDTCGISYTSRDVRAMLERLACTSNSRFALNIKHTSVFLACLERCSDKADG